jgi:hypothetical protein
MPSGAEGSKQNNGKRNSCECGCANNTGQKQYTLLTGTAFTLTCFFFLNLDGHSSVLRVCLTFT